MDSIFRTKFHTLDHMGITLAMAFLFSALLVEYYYSMCARYKCMYNNNIIMASDEIGVGCFDQKSLYLGNDRSA